MRRLLLIGLLALAGCGGGPEVRAKEEVAALLRDPSSAQFRDVKVAGGVVCGEVNGKNAYGAYVGFKMFVFDGLSAEIEPAAVAMVNAPSIPEMEARTSFLRRYTDCLVAAG